MALVDLLSLAPFVLFALAAASTGAIFKPGPWYAALEKPPLTPPNWMFPVVWGILYVGIAVAAWRVWLASGLEALGPLLLWGAHLGLNAAWSWLFFGRKRIDLALLEILPFWLSILAVILLFAQHDRLAAWLLVPYLAWVTVAAALNWGFWRLNGARGTTEDLLAQGDSPVVPLSGASRPVK
jgi:tryptophan-rich sensory protein